MKRTLTILSLLLLLPASALALEVAEGVITSGIQEHQPSDRLTSVPASSDTIYCFTRIAGAEGDTTVTHLWLKDDREMARVVLPVRSANWRTWSSKQLTSDWRGNWRVAVLDAAGHELASIPFTVE